MGYARRAPSAHSAMAGSLPACGLGELLARTWQLRFRGTLTLETPGGDLTVIELSSGRVRLTPDELREIVPLAPGTCYAFEVATGVPSILPSSRPPDHSGRRNALRTMDPFLAVLICLQAVDGRRLERRLRQYLHTPCRLVSESLALRPAVFASFSPEQQQLVGRLVDGSVSLSHLRRRGLVGDDDLLPMAATLYLLDQLRFTDVVASVAPDPLAQDATDGAARARGADSDRLARAKTVPEPRRDVAETPTLPPAPESPPPAAGDWSTHHVARVLRRALTPDDQRAPRARTVPGLGEAPPPLPNDRGERRRTRPYVFDDDD